MSDPLPPIKLSSRDTELLALYAEDLLTADQAAELNARLHEAPELLSAIAQLGEIEEHVRSLLSEGHAADRGDWFVLMSELAQASDADAVPVSFDAFQAEQRRKADGQDAGEKSSVFHDGLSIAGYLLRRAGYKPLAYAAAVAAALVLGVTLLIALQSGQNEPTELVTPPTQIIRPAKVVATLTNTHNAVWAGAASATPAPGDTLRAGQTLTLTEGFAEITTKQGAVAILEAPVTIELLDNNNAIRLHTGKLVGVCETESSKGFLVRTSHMDITDLGTRFGVVVSSSGVSTAHVFEGEVAAAAVSPEFNDAEPIYLTQGQSAQVDASVSARVVRFVPSLRPSFVHDFKAVTRTPQITGQIEYQPALPGSLAPSATESDKIQLYPEAMGVRLDRGFRAMLTGPGKHETFATEDAQPVGETRVDAYLVHYDFKLGDGDAGKPRNATIRFDRPILGVIADEKLLFVSDRLFSPVGTDFGPSVNPRDPDLPTGRGLEPKLSLPGDIVEISQDRRTLTIELYGAMAVDQLRVLVQSPEPTAQ